MREQQQQTALDQYARLEAAGLWRQSPGAMRREVIVGLRQATLLLTDPKSEMPLSQWSLPAILRLSEVAGFVTFTPHEDGEETLEIDDPDMIAALDKLRAAIDRRRKRPGRLRSALAAGAAALVLGVGLIWMPLRLNSFVAERLPEAARADLANRVLADVITLSGSPCAAQSGQAAAAALAARLDPSAPPQILVLKEGLSAPLALPSGLILLPYAMVESAEGPDLVAGLVLAEMTRAKMQDPALPILEYAGFVATLRLLSSGALPDGALAGFGLALANAARPSLTPEVLEPAFTAAGLTALPYLESLHQGGEPGLATMIDPVPGGSDPISMDDASFLSLQYICGT